MPDIVGTHTLFITTANSGVTRQPVRVMRTGLGAPETFSGVNNTGPANGNGGIGTNFIEYSPNPNFVGIDHLIYAIATSSGGYFEGYAVFVVLPQVSGSITWNDRLDRFPTTMSVRVTMPDGSVWNDELPVSEGGSYFFYGPAVAGKSTVTIKAGTYLSQKRSYNTNVTGNALLDFSLVNGDVDGDDSITIFDYIDLSGSFDKSEGDAGYLPQADLDGDGAVTIFDYIILSQNFDLSGPIG